MASMETAVLGVPDFGTVVARRHLLGVARVQCPELTVVCAPPGYGKSVLAAQMAAQPGYDVVLWVPLYDSDIRGDEWAHKIIETLSSAACLDRMGAATLPMGPDSPRADDLLRVREGLADYAGQCVLLVLDGAARLDGLDILVGIAKLLRDSTNVESRVVVTCRVLDRRGYAPSPSRVWLIGDQELRFDTAEVQELLALTGYASDAQSDATVLLDRFAGHPALTSLMLRHPRTDDSANPPQDLVWHARRLVSQIDDRTFPTLYCAALLREGSVSELDGCLVSAGQQDAEWEAAQVAAPLLTLAFEQGDAPSSFRMHAVLCDAMLSSVLEASDSRVPDCLRASVLEHLYGIRDAARLQGVLLTACTHVEIADFCERSGLWLLHRCGATTIERCLNRIPAARASSSARLLLLRSATLRERELVEEALTHASIAQHIAELDADTSTQASAVLLTARLALDAGDLGKAGPPLRQLGGCLRSSLSAPALCLCESFAAVVDAYACNPSDAKEHLDLAAQLLRDVDKRSPEAVWSANYIAGVEGQLLGRWDLVSARLASMRTWPGLTPLQSLQCNANAAVALLELGSTAEAEALLEAVLEDSAGAELHLLRAYALGTLADVRWTAGGADCQPLAQESRRVFADRGDRAALAGEHTVQAMLQRAAGLREESLVLAESALAYLQDDRCQLNLFKVAAEIEVAASMLALGDRWGARRLANRASAELAKSEAAAHLFCLEMVLSELDRQEGDAGAAITRLQPHAGLVTTGSVNWRAAMYIRAFPGLLGLLASAVGADTLPLRMLKLIPSENMAEALRAEFFASPDVHSTMTARVLCLSDAGHTAEVVGAETPACRVRFFGGLEVTTESGTIEDSVWRKRKARLVFAMLAVNQGRDLSRELIMERLWPDMDEERARRNFYVTWSTMKRVLARGSAPSGANNLVQCAGGVCRVTHQVHSDLDDFDSTICRLRAAIQAQDRAGVLESAQSLQDIYKGALLPGDLYDECFNEARERTRHDFCDAMMSAASFAERHMQPDIAIPQLRRASEIDPWREDIYQAMMRCQMHAGQRSRAIETYMACRTRLVEDLGIDPSSETARLYQAILTMETSTAG